MSLSISQEKFEELSKCEKKKLLSMDLIERMIRVEQHVLASMGKRTSYTETQFYKSLSPREKEKFDRYLKNKGKKKYFALILILPLVLFFLTQVNVTGNIISENSNRSFNSFLGYFSILVFVAAIFIYLFIRNSRKRRYERYSWHFKLFEETLRKKRA